MKVGPGRRQAAALVVPPVLAWLAGHALYWAAAAHNGFDHFLVRTHARWDSGNYLNIARHGYTLLRCVPKPTSPFTAADWCGTAGWFPLYPLGMRLLGPLGLPYPRAGLLITELFALGSLVLVWWLLEARATLANLACLALAALFPGSIYEHALFPVSLAVAGSLLFLALLARGRWTAAGIAGAVPAARYQFLLATGIVLVAVGATLAARQRNTLDLVVLVYTVMFWVAPLVAGGHLAQYRTHLLLLPSVVLLRRLPAVVPAVLAVMAAAVAWQMAGLFYHYILI